MPVIGRLLARQDKKHGKKDDQAHPRPTVCVIDRSPQLIVTARAKAGAFYTVLGTGDIGVARDLSKSCGFLSAPDDGNAAGNPFLYAPPGMTDPPSPKATAGSRKNARRATSYVTAPASEPLRGSDPLPDIAPVPHTAPRMISITPDRQQAVFAKGARPDHGHAPRKLHASREAGETRPSAERNLQRLAGHLILGRRSGLSLHISSRDLLASPTSRLRYVKWIPYIGNSRVADNTYFA